MNLRNLFTFQCVILSCITSFAQDAGSIRFKIDQIPFSRYGSYMSFISSRDHKKGGETLILQDLKGSTFWENGKYSLHIKPVVDGNEITVNYEGGVKELTGVTEKGNLHLYFEDPRTFHIATKSSDIIITGNIHTTESLGAPIFPLAGEYANTTIMLDQSMALTPKKGTATFEDGKITLKRNEQGELDVVLEQCYGDWIPRHYTETREESLLEIENEFNRWQKGMPSVSPAYEKGKDLAAYVNWSSIFEPRGNITRPGMAMSKRHMTYIWSWDHCFNAMSLSYGHPRLSWDQFMIMFDHQNKENGALPDLISAESIAWRFKKPPIHGWVLKNLMNHYTLSSDQKAEAYEKLSKWTYFWLNCRDTDANGLPCYYGGDSGWDNGTIFDMCIPAESPDLAAYLVLQMEVLSDLATQLSFSKEAKEWKERSEVMLKKAITRFWNGDRFVARKMGTDEYNPDSQSLLSYIPLLLGKRLPKEIRDKMIADLKIEGLYLNAYGLSTESPQSKLFQNDSYWRGPIWAPTVVQVTYGLRECGETELAKEVAKRFCNNCLKSGFAENFSSLNGAPLRDLCYTWTSSAYILLAHEFLFSK